MGLPLGALWLLLELALLSASVGPCQTECSGEGAPEGLSGESALRSPSHFEPRAGDGGPSSKGQAAQGLTGASTCPESSLSLGPAAAEAREDVAACGGGLVCDCDVIDLPSAARGRQLLVLLVHSRTCANSQRLRKELEIAARTLWEHGEHHIVFRAVDITPSGTSGGSVVHLGAEAAERGVPSSGMSNERAVALLGVRSTPALLLLRPGAEAEAYQGPRRGVPMARVLRDKAGPPTASLASWEAAQAFVESNTVAVLGVLGASHDGARCHQDWAGIVRESCKAGAAAAAAGGGESCRASGGGPHSPSDAFAAFCAAAARLRVWLPFAHIAAAPGTASSLQAPLLPPWISARASLEGVRDGEGKGKGELQGPLPLLLLFKSYDRPLAVLPLARSAWHAARLCLTGEQETEAGAAPTPSAADIEKFLLHAIVPVLLGPCCPSTTGGDASQAHSLAPRPWADTHQQSPAAGSRSNTRQQKPSTQQSLQGACPSSALPHPVLRTSVLQAPIIRDLPQVLLLLPTRGKEEGTPSAEGQQWAGLCGAFRAQAEAHNGRALWRAEPAHSNPHLLTLNVPTFKCMGGRRLPSCDPCQHFSLIEEDLPALVAHHAASVWTRKWRGLDRDGALVMEAVAAIQDKLEWAARESAEPDSAYLWEPLFGSLGQSAGATAEPPVSPDGGAALREILPEDIHRDVLQQPHPVVLLLYAPWCRHCPRAEALLQAAAADCTTGDGAKSRLEYLKLNGELGDLPAMFIAVGYPSVFVVKPRRACSRDPTVHRYEGDLTCTALRVLAEVPAC